MIIDLCGLRRQGMNRLSRDRRCEVLELLNEGMSIRAVGRHTSIHRVTILKLLADAGRACKREHARRVRDLSCQYVQADELWCVVGEKGWTGDTRDTSKDVWTFTALDETTKLLITWLAGARTVAAATRFLVDLGRRIKGEFQLSTDAATIYREAVMQAYGGHVDYGQIWKHSVPREQAASVPKIKRTPIRVFGDPDLAHIQTMFVERHNLTMRMALRRYTRETNAFSRTFKNHLHALAVYAVHYNFVRPHETLTSRAFGRPTTPAMAAGLARHRWTMQDLVGLVEEREENAIQVARRRKDRRRPGSISK